MAANGMPHLDLNSLVQLFKQGNKQQGSNTLDANSILGLFQGKIPQTSQPATLSSNPDTSSIQAYAQQAVQKAFPNDPNAWNSFNSIVNKESGWNPKAANKTSTARGLMQFLAGTAPSYGLPADASQASPQDQINAGIKYISSRYATPTKAWDFHTKKGWY